MSYDVLENYINFTNGKWIKRKKSGKYPIYGANGIIGYTNNYIFEKVIAIGRVGSIGTVTKIKEKSWLSDNTITAMNKENSDFQYIYYVLKNLKLYQYGIGSTQPLLTQDIIRNLKHYFPRLSEQKAIANILSSLDDKIELNNKINKNLEELAQTLYKRWFVEFEFPNEEGLPYKSNGGKMVESELGLIP